MRSHRRFMKVVIASTLILTGSAAFAEDGTGIGFYTTVSGRVSVMHPHQNHVIPVTLHDHVLFKDVIQTQSQSRTKAFFQDDSILTVGENSRVEINEYIYKPEDNVRKAVVKLLEGQVRALVSKVFKANGSRFEVHTPSAVAAARGTYFTVWVENGQSGIINIGETGRVDFTSGGTTVGVEPGYFSVARNGEAPSVPVKHHVGDKFQPLANSSLKQQEEAPGLQRALAAVERTILSDGMLAELPSELFQAMTVDTHLVTTLTTMVGADTVLSGGTLGGIVQGDSTGISLGSVSAGVGSTGLTATVGPVSVGPISTAPINVTVAPTVVAPVVPVTPPAVINGALNLLGK